MSANLCEHCTATCCHYIALPIETPETLSEFEDVRWYLIHENISIFVEGGDWYICVHTPCRHLLADHRCGIYETRPHICRRYTTENCDYHSGDYGWEQHFTSPEHLEAYVREHPPKAEGGRKGKGKAGGKRGAKRLGGAKKVGPRPHYLLGAEGVMARSDRHGVALPILPG